jgi:hypothetical protein
LAKVVAVYTDASNINSEQGNPKWAALFKSEDGDYVEVPWDLETKNLGDDLVDAAEGIGQGI